ncbi:Gis4p SCDLUD_003306 [Saccharomycodes ludwigii]|uniref:Gis4p n=1 Tax=Saccharomycodes ludwigii TaxID=36035 RepID=UPI001E88BA08|nr:hypothetical protein SCDLUD_003306 [Saccharomycodes ludwigii]KAH3900332.1 hypothetical protein SCDLUD_003306 [Saccharomycodes ludwigii]
MPAHHSHVVKVKDYFDNDYNGLWSWYLSNLRKGNFEEITGNILKFTLLKRFLNEYLNSDEFQFNKKILIVSIPDKIHYQQDITILENFLKDYFKLNNLKYIQITKLTTNDRIYNHENHYMIMDPLNNFNDKFFLESKNLLNNDSNSGGSAIKDHNNNIDPDDSNSYISLSSSDSLNTSSSSSSTGSSTSSASCSAERSPYHNNDTNDQHHYVGTSTSNNNNNNSANRNSIAQSFSSPRNSKIANSGQVDQISNRNNITEDDINMGDNVLIQQQSINSEEYDDDDDDDDDEDDSIISTNHDNNTTDLHNKIMKMEFNFPHHTITNIHKQDPSQQPQLEKKFENLSLKKKDTLPHDSQVFSNDVQVLNHTRNISSVMSDINVDAESVNSYAYSTDEDFGSELKHVNTREDDADLHNKSDVADTKQEYDASHDMVDYDDEDIDEAAIDKEYNFDDDDGSDNEDDSLCSIFPSISISADFGKFRLVLQIILIQNPDTREISTAIRQMNNNPTVANQDDDWLLYDQFFRMDNLQMLSLKDILGMNRYCPKILFYSMVDLTTPSKSPKKKDIDAPNGNDHLEAVDEIKTFFPSNTTGNNEDFNNYFIDDDQNCLSKQSTFTKDTLPVGLYSDDKLGANASANGGYTDDDELENGVKLYNANTNQTGYRSIRTIESVGVGDWAFQNSLGNSNTNVFNGKDNDNNNNKINKIPLKNNKNIITANNLNNNMDHNAREEKKLSKVATIGSLNVVERSKSTPLPDVLRTLSGMDETTSKNLKQKFKKNKFIRKKNKFTRSKERQHAKNHIRDNTNCTIM